MALPPMQIYAFEDELEKAVQSFLLMNGVNEVSKQREDRLNLDGKVHTLRTPRVQAQCVFHGFGPNEHYYVVPSTGIRWLDIGKGTLYLKVVTRREVNEQSHAALRGLCRYLMQQVQKISTLLKYHIVEKMIEQSCTLSFDPDRIHDISALSFDVWLRIRNSNFPTS